MYVPRTYAETSLYSLECCGMCCATQVDTEILAAVLAAAVHDSES
jgi:hypothetical protein